METNPHWLTLYEAAVLELDLNKLPQRIKEAQHAIVDRMEVLGKSGGTSELEVLMNALNGLWDLQKMADRESRRVIQQNPPGNRGWRTHNA